MEGREKKVTHTKHTHAGLHWLNVISSDSDCMHDPNQKLNTTPQHLDPIRAQRSTTGRLLAISETPAGDGAEAGAGKTRSYGEDKAFWVSGGGGAPTVCPHAAADQHMLR